MPMTTFEAIWTDGHGGHMNIYFTNNLITKKTQSKLK